MNLGEVTIWIFRLLFMIDLFGYVEDLICETLQSVIVLSLVLSLRVEIQITK
jgi:hypothetical protein